MAEELMQLKELVAQLQAENQRLQAQEAVPGTSAASVTNFSSQPLSNAPVVERLVYVPRDRKCPMFRGKTGLSVSEWSEEVQACMRARHLSRADQAAFIYDHLEGEAREEMRYRPREEREDPDKILDILQDLYGCSKSYVSLQEDFFSRKQQEGETLQEFSHALMNLMDRVVTNAPNGLPNSSVLLRDQFVEHVYDCALRRELKQYVRRQPTATLLDVRSEAIRWEREGMPGGARGRSNSVPSTAGFQFALVGSPHSGSGNLNPKSELNELKEMLRKQQEQLNQLSSTLLAIQNAPRPSFGKTKQSVICRRCHKPGHFARECDGERVRPSVPQTSSVAPSSGNRPQYQSQQSGNFHPLNY